MHGFRLQRSISQANNKQQCINIQLTKEFLKWETECRWHCWWVLHSIIFFLVNSFTFSRICFALRFKNLSGNVTKNNRTTNRRIFVIDKWPPSPWFASTSRIEVMCTSQPPNLYFRANSVFSLDLRFFIYYNYAPLEIIKLY